jgi:hypothetical protein
LTTYEWINVERQQPTAAGDRKTAKGDSYRRELLNVPWPRATEAAKYSWIELTNHFTGLLGPERRQSSGSFTEEFHKRSSNPTKYHWSEICIALNAEEDFTVE